MITAPFIGISRHRLGVDGVGVTTLAAFHGCPLRCHYCLNRRCLQPPAGLPVYTPEALFDETRIDNLYFLATGGGICFGGGEPLLRMDFIERFRQLCGPAWRLTAETSLAVPRSEVQRAAELFDAFIVDIKELNPHIYHAYTGGDGQLAAGNLRYLLETKGSDPLIVRVPRIPDYNTEADTDATVAQLKAMGVAHIDRFQYLVRDDADRTPPDASANPQQSVN